MDPWEAVGAIKMLTAHSYEYSLVYICALDGFISNLLSVSAAAFLWCDYGWESERKPDKKGHWYVRKKSQLCSNLSQIAPILFLTLCLARWTSINDFFDTVMCIKY